MLLSARGELTLAPVMSTKTRALSKAKQRKSVTQSAGEETGPDISEKQRTEFYHRFHSLILRLEETFGPKRKALCREVAQVYRQNSLYNEDMATLTRWVEAYHHPTAAAFRRNVDGTAPVEALIESAGAAVGYTLLAPSELRLTRTRRDAEAAKWLREVIVERNTTKLRELIKLLNLLPPSTVLRENMKSQELPVSLFTESRFCFAKSVHETYQRLGPEHGRLPSKLALREAVEKRNHGRATPTSQWSKTLKQLGLGGLPRRRTGGDSRLSQRRAAGRRT